MSTRRLNESLSHMRANMLSPNNQSITTPDCEAINQMYDAVICLNFHLPTMRISLLPGGPQSSPRYVSGAEIWPQVL